MKACAVYELDQYTSRGPGVDERDHALRAATWRPIDELDAVAPERRERGREVVDHVADVMERGPSPLREELRDTRLPIDGLDQLDALSIAAEKGHPDSLVRKLAHGLGGEAERVAIERQRVLYPPDRDADVVQRAQVHVRGGTYVANTSRRSEQISPRRTAASDPPRIT